MAVHNSLPSLPPLFSSHVFLFPCVFLSVSSLPSFFWCVLVIDILANGCISFSRHFTRASPYIIGVYMQLVLLYNPSSFLSS